MGGLLGGFPFGGKYPAISSMYSTARRLLVPDCVRIHARVAFSSIETKNMRSASPRCAMLMTDTRGFPSGVNRKRPTSSGSPCVHAAKPGEASRLFRLMASSKRSFGG